METFGNKKMVFVGGKEEINYYCQICDVICCWKSNYLIHIKTKKHIRKQMETNFVGNLKIVGDENKAKKYDCNCGLIYKTRAGLYKHLKKCSFDKKINENNSNDNFIDDNKDLKNMFIDIVNENKELRKMIQEQQNHFIELLNKIGNTTNITNNTTNNTNHFNLQLFLNEQCKDAININDFVNSLEITIDDLNYTKDNGLIKGITDIMIRGLKELDIYKRPIHCTDTKRETLYIKDENKWEKDEHNEKIKETILTMANKERNAINEWKEAYPLWNKNEDVQDEFMLLVNKVYTPIEEQEKYEKKIIKALTKEVSIEK